MHDWEDITSDLFVSRKDIVLKCKRCQLVKDEALNSTYEATYWMEDNKGSYKFISGIEISCDEMKLKNLIG